MKNIFKNVGRRFRRSLRAISPVIAVLLMIVIAVAASLVAYAWVMGYLGFTTSKVGKAIQIQSIARDSGNAVTIWVQNVGDSDVVLSDVYVNDVLTDGSLDIPLPATDTEMIPLSGTHSGLQVKVKVVTNDGSFIEYTKTFTSTSGGGGVPVEPPTVTQISSVTTGFSGVQAGDLLVVIPNTRGGTFTTDTLTCTAAGYTPVEVASFMTSDQNRRAVAVLIKVAEGTESGTLSVNWGGSGVTTYATIYQIYRGATTYTPNGESGVNHNGVTLGTSLTVPSAPLSAGTTANILTIGAVVFRDDPGAVSMTNLDFQDIASSGGSNPCVTVSESSYGDAVTQTAVTWATNRLASGLLVQIACD